MLRAGRTVGMFQLESSGMTSTLRRLQPTTIDDLAAIIALYRPGPMQHIDRYIDTMHGREQPVYPHPKLEPILRETHGVLVYADQVLRVVRELAGYDWDEADRFRKAVGKKIRAALEKERAEFIERAVAKRSHAVSRRGRFRSDRSRLPATASTRRMPSPTPSSPTGPPGSRRSIPCNSLPP